jgi:hypothetical protein
MVDGDLPALLLLRRFRSSHDVAGGVLQGREPAAAALMCPCLGCGPQLEGAP